MVEWICGLAAAVAILGPGLGRGDLLNLDLVTTPRLRYPDWRWGVGPGLPHRVPLYVPLAWLSSFLDGAVVVKGLYLGALAALFVGVWRLAGSGDRRVDAGVALAITWSPFTTTRVAVGHLSVVVAMATVAWAAPALFRLDAAARRPTRRLAGLAAFGGLVPGTWTLAVGAAGVIGGPKSERRSRARQWLWLLPLQLWWLVPSALFAAAGPHLVGAGGFRPSIDVLAPLELLGGLGFWRIPSQVPGPPWWPLIAAALLGAAALGRSATRTRFGRPWALATTVAALVPVAAVLPPCSWLVRRLSDTFVGAPLREAQRWWGLALVLLAPAVAAGVVEFGRRVGSTRALVPVLPAAAALLLGGNGLWGMHGALAPVSYPAGWAATATALRREPGATLALPWHQYLDVSFAGGRRVLNPLPDYLPGDVVSSTDPELGVPQEQVDARAAPALAALEHPVEAASGLAALGIRYVVVARLGPPDAEVDQLARSSGVTTVYADPDIVLLRIDATATRPVSWWFGPFGRLAAGSAPLGVPAGPGWLLGGRSVPSSGGLLRPGPGSGVLWYWPGVLVASGDLCAALCWLSGGWGGLGSRRRFLRTADAQRT